MFCTKYFRGEDVSHHHRQLKYHGVTSTQSGKWLAKIKVNSKDEWLGTFKDEEEAVHAFNWCAIEAGQQPNFSHSDLHQGCSEHQNMPLHYRQSHYHSVYLTKLGRWQVQIWVDGKMEPLGTFKDEEDAACAFDHHAVEVG